MRHRPRRDKFNPVAERILREKPIPSSHRYVVLNGATGSLKSRTQAHQIAAGQRDMRLFRRSKIGLNPQMQLQRPHREPASAPPRHVRRFGDFRQPDQSGVKSPRHSLPAGRDGDLHMVDGKIPAHSAISTAWIAIPTIPPTNVPLMRIYWRSRPTALSSRSVTVSASQLRTVSLISRTAASP